MRSAADVAENVPPAFEALDQHVERVVGIRNHVGVPGTARVLRRWRPRGLRRLLPDSSALPKLALRMSCAYGRATPSTTFEVKMIDGDLLTIGELAQRTGVARSALRYYEELDILQPNDRRSGQRRYDEAAVALVGAILLLREVGFSLTQIRQILRPGRSPWVRRRVVRVSMTAFIAAAICSDCVAVGGALPDAPARCRRCGRTAAAA